MNADYIFTTSALAVCFCLGGSAFSGSGAAATQAFNTTTLNLAL